eukprot:6188785-Pleurochrysis_carterae.AAC.1
MVRRERSDLASDLQSLCWGSLGTCQLPALIASGYALSAFGPRILFAAAAVLSSSLLLPGWHRWLGDSRISDENGIAATVHGAKGRWAALVAHPSKRLAPYSNVLQWCLTGMSYSESYGSARVRARARASTRVGSRPPGAWRARRASWERTRSLWASLSSSWPAPRRTPPPPSPLAATSSSAPVSGACSQRRAR